MLNAGDKVKIKSFGWYLANKNSHDFIEKDGTKFVTTMKPFCSETVEIVEVLPDGAGYHIDRDNQKHVWKEWMFQLD